MKICKVERECTVCREVKDVDYFSSVNGGICNGRVCIACRREKNREAMTGKYVPQTYTHCVKCGGEKEKPNSNTRCKVCIRKQVLVAREESAYHIMSRPDNLNELVKYLIKKVTLNNMDVEVRDINDIITYYTYITQKSFEYDNMGSGAQVRSMFLDLCAYERGLHKKNNTNGKEGTKIRDIFRW